MTQQVGTASKAALADATLVGPLPRVPAPVAREVRAEVEALGAQITLLKAHARVAQQVFHKCLLVRERFAADFALMGLPDPVDHLMCPQLVDTRERAGAHLALEWPLGSTPVHLDVHCQPLGCRKHPLATRAQMLLPTGARVIDLLLHEQTSRVCGRQVADCIPVVFVFQYFLSE